MEDEIENQDLDLGAIITKVFGTISQEHLTKDEESGEQTYAFAPAHGLQATLSYRPQEKVAELELYAYTNGPALGKIIWDLKALQNQRLLLGEYTQSDSNIRLKHEDETGDCKAFEIKIPITTEVEMVKLINRIKYTQEENERQTPPWYK